MKIYYTKPGESLTGLCHEIRLENPEFLRDYHNQNCPLSERFDGDIAPGMKLYIPSSSEIRELNRKIRASHQSFYDFPPEGKFLFDFRHWEGNYQVVQTTQWDDLTLAKYENKIRLHFGGIKNGQYHFLFSASDFRKNGEAPDAKADALARMCMEVIYPLRYIVDPEGTLIDILPTSQPEVLVSELDAIRKFFSDRYSAQYIEKMKEMAENPGMISQKFKNTLFNALMFGAFYRTPLANWNVSDTYREVYPWIFDAQPIRFEFQNILLPKDTLDDKTVKIQQKGISCDHRSLEELYFIYDQEGIAKDPIGCEHFAGYFFKRDNLSLCEIEAVFRYFGPENRLKQNFSVERITDPYYI